MEKISNETIKENLSVTDEQMKTEIRRIINEAKSRAIESDIIDKMLSEKKRIQSVSPAEFLKNLDEYIKIDEEIKKHTILIKTLNEFKILLELLELSEAYIKDTLEHENAHANKVESLDAVLEGYTMIISKNENDYLYSPSVSYSVPNQWDEIKKMKVILEIANAPKDYGNRLSDGDKEKIKTIEEQLRQLV